MLDGQRQRVDIPARAGTVVDELPQKTLEKDLLNRLSCPFDGPTGQGA